MEEFNKHVIAEEILKIQPEDMLRVNTMIGTTISKSRELDKDVKCIFENDEMVLAFMVNLYCLDDQQFLKVKEELERLIHNNEYIKKNYFVIFSFNPYNPDFLYKTGIFVREITTA